MFDSPTKILRRRIKIILFVGIVVAVITCGLSFLLPLMYRADTQVLIISQSRSGVDPYTVVKSAERIGENVSQVMRTSDFYQKVQAQKEYTGIDWSYFERLSERKKRRLWQKTLEPSIVYGTGVLNISVYHRDKNQAMMLAGACAKALMTRGQEYVGGDVNFKVVNDPIVSNWYARPNIPLNMVLGFVVGVFLMGIIVVRKR